MPCCRTWYIPHLNIPSPVGLPAEQVGVTQQAPGATWAALLGGHALLPDMMFPTVNRFNPANGPLLPSPKGAPPAPSTLPCRRLSLIQIETPDL